MSLFSKKPPTRPAAPTPLSPHPPARPGPDAPLTIKGFDVVQPSHAFDNQPRLPMGYGKGVDYPYIPAEGHLPFVDLPAKLLSLLHLCWEAGKVNSGAARSTVQIGMNAAPRVPMPHAKTPASQLGTGARADHMQGKAVPQYKKALGPLCYGGVISDFKLTEKLERVNAYTFRGERGRSPQEIEAAGGFHPPIKRTDKWYVDTIAYPYFAQYFKSRFGPDDVPTADQFYKAYTTTLAPHERTVLQGYVDWWRLVERESHHVGQMVVKEDLKGYVSTTRLLHVAYMYAGTNCSRGGSGTNGWVYVLRTRGGFNLTKGHKWNTKQGENEIAFPGSVGWDEVFAFRKVGRGFTGPVYMRTGFQSANPAAYKEVFELLSGKNQRYD